MMSGSDKLCEICKLQFQHLDNLIDHYLHSHIGEDFSAKISNKAVRDYFYLNQSDDKAPAQKLEYVNINEVTQMRIPAQMLQAAAPAAVPAPEVNNKEKIVRKCDVCFEEVSEDWKKYALHVTENHNPFAAKSYIEDSFILGYILNGGHTRPKTCDICNLAISQDINDYIVHIQKSHSYLINKSLSKYVKDKYVVSALLGKSLYKTSSVTVFCNVCNEGIDGFEEMREHMQEHKKMQNAHQRFFPSQQQLASNAQLQFNMEEIEKFKIEEAARNTYTQKACKIHNLTFFNNNNNRIKNDENNIKNKNTTDNEGVEKLNDILLNLFADKINPDKNEQNLSINKEIQELKAKINILESKVNIIENQLRLDIDERDKLQTEINNKLTQNSDQISNMEKEFEKLTILEDRINQNKKKIEEEKLLRESDCNKHKAEVDLKIKDCEGKMQLLDRELKSLDKQELEKIIKDYHQQEKLLAALKIEILEMKNNQYSAIPEDWVPQLDYLLLVDLGLISPEYIQISKMFLNTLQQGKIIKITRIQNIPLWKNYCFGKLQLKEKGNCTEKLLFHGTRYTDPKVIYSAKEEGFDMRFSQKGYFGEAIYFHERANYSHDYRFSLQNGNFFMFIANVLVGSSIEIKQNDPNLRLPPIKNIATNERYDSVNSEGKYMVYNNFRAYPAYLLEYSI